MTTAEKIIREIAELREHMRTTYADGCPRFYTPHEMFAWLDCHAHPIQSADTTRRFLVRVIAEWRQNGNVAQLHMGADALREKLLDKNAKYGDSALSPVRIFSDAPADAALRVRIDDKLSRLMRGSDAGEDTIGDLAGYLVLLLIAMRDTAEVTA